MSATCNINDFLAGLKRIDADIRLRAERALNKAGEYVLGKAKERTPYDLGNLQKSATAEPAKWSGNIITKRIGSNTKYAAIVHETWQQGQMRSVTTTRTSKSGKTRKSTRNAGNKNSQARAKFLEMAVRENADKVNVMIATAIKGGGN